MNQPQTSSQSDGSSPFAGKNRRDVSANPPLHHLKPLEGFPCRLLALDIDGTLLDREGTLRESTAQAIRKAEAAGIQVVLCTGRRYRKALPIALMLDLHAPLVCNSGAIVKDPADHRTILRADLEPPVLRDVLDVFHQHGEPIVSFTDRPIDDRDFLIEQDPTGREHFDDYLARNRGHASVNPDWTRQAKAGHAFHQGHFHLCGIGKIAEMLELQTALHKRINDRIRTFVQKSPKYTGTMCEVLQSGASKWSAVVHIANGLGIGATEIVAIGDDMNDLPMIQGAGLGVAMGHAPDSVREAADFVTGDHDNDSVGMVIRAILKSQP